MGPVPRKLPFLSTAPGDCAAVLYAASFALAVFVSLLILIATVPDHFSDALDGLFSPLAHVGLRGHEMAVVMTLMLHFTPVLVDRASAIIDDQSMRDGKL